VGRYGESVPLLLDQPNNLPKRTPPMSTGLQAIDSEILMKKSWPDMVEWLTQLSEVALWERKCVHHAASD
jgi:hypothetical protein